MEKCPGIELGRLWDDMSGRQKNDVVRQVASYSARLSKARFPCYGSLYHAKDIPDIRGTEVDDCFAVGPTTSRTWFDDKRAEVNVDRGPCKIHMPKASRKRMQLIQSFDLGTSVEDVLTAIIKRETACLNTFSDFPRDRQQGIFNGPGGYKPSKKPKLAAIEDYCRVLSFIVPKHDAQIASILWHNDLHSDNIFVDKDHPTEITGIIDWQGVHLSPAFLHVHYPSLIEYDGPVLDVFEKPQLPDNIAELDPVAQEDARALHLAQSIWGLYQIFIQNQAPDLLRTLRYRDTLSCQIMTLIGSIFDDGEAYIQTLLSDLAEPETWEKVLKSNGQEATNISCPLVYSHHEVSRQRDELAKWERAVELKARVIKEVGAYTGWDGAVSPDEFEVVSERLQKAWERFVDAESTTPEERDQWVMAWPFKDEMKT